MMATTMVSTSATGMASHTPSRSRYFGKNRMHPLIQTKVRREEISAESAPLESAVKNAEANIFTPQNRKFHAQILYPSNVRVNVELSLGVNTSMVGSASRNESTLITAEETNMMPMDILNSRFSWT